MGLSRVSFDLAATVGITAAPFGFGTFLGGCNLAKVAFVALFLEASGVSVAIDDGAIMGVGTNAIAGKGAGRDGEDGKQFERDGPL